MWHGPTGPCLGRFARGVCRDSWYLVAMDDAASDQRVAPLIIRQGANLPHWTRDGATYFVTYRLADSLPQGLLNAWIAERDHIIVRARQMEQELTEYELTRLDELHSEKVESYLDAGHGACWMSSPAIARVVRDAMFHFEGVRHEVHAWCVMPNHVHAVVRPLAGFSLSQVLHGWKGYSGREANKALGRTGMFWQPEPYDHLVRDRADLERCVRYVLDNPVKAGLREWEWVGARVA
jgi:REP element-mobilizing transposase RayT